jgi:hypothetical protein
MRSSAILRYPFPSLTWKKICYQNKPKMKAHVEAQAHALYDNNKDSFARRGIQRAEVTYFLLVTALISSGPAHANDNDSNLHVTLELKD